MKTTEHKLSKNKKEERNVDLPECFDEHPALKKKLQDYLKTIPESEKQKTYRDYQRFVNGEVTWGEIRKISKRLQKEIARVAFMHFKFKRFQKAETLYKGLTIADHTNWFFRASLAAVYQQQKRYEEAIDEYAKAIFIKSDAALCLINKAECLMMIEEYDEALDDLETVLSLKLAGNNPWKMRADMLKNRVAVLRGS